MYRGGGNFMQTVDWRCVPPAANYDVPAKLDSGLCTCGSLGNVKLGLSWF